MPYTDPEICSKIILNHHPHRGISRDEARYPDAEKFMPERFLDAGGKLIDDDPSEFVFGFGRRKCPGRSLAYRHAMSRDPDLYHFQADTLQTHPCGVPFRRCWPRLILILPRIRTETMSHLKQHSQMGELGTIG